MTNIYSIRAKGLSKMYSIGNGPQQTLRGTIGNLFKPNKYKKQFWALNDLTFDIEPGDVVGIMGGNGAGKSTLLKLLSKITYPTKGTAEILGRVTSMLEVGSGFHPELTGMENIFLNGSLLGMTKSEIKKNLEEIIEFSGLREFINTPVKRYSSGMYVRLAFSVTAHLRTEILLLDEILAVGDAEFQKKCISKMSEINESGKTILFVSHNYNTLEKVCNRFLYLDQGKLISDTTNIYDAAPKHVPMSRASKTYLENSPINCIELYQKNKSIIIQAKYNLSSELLIPNFGFECTNSLGNYITSYNPLLEGHKYLTQKYPNKGTIQLEITSPILQDGNYTFKFYFGDGTKDTFQDLMGLTIAISGMSPWKNVKGIVTPECKFSVT